jgi:hypothetical protein
MTLKHPGSVLSPELEIQATAKDISDTSLVIQDLETVISIKSWRNPDGWIVYVGDLCHSLSTFSLK